MRAWDDAGGLKFSQRRGTKPATMGSQKGIAFPRPVKIIRPDPQAAQATLRASRLYTRMRCWRTWGGSGSLLSPLPELPPKFMGLLLPDWYEDMSEPPRVLPMRARHIPVGLLPRWHIWD